MKQLEVYLQDRPIGTVKIDCVRGRETWMFAYDPSFVKASNPMLDPDIANVRGPQFPRGGAGFGFLSDIAHAESWAAYVQTNAVLPTAWKYFTEQFRPYVRRQLVPADEKAFAKEMVDLADSVAR